MKGNDIAEGLLEFAVAVLEITTRLPANSSLPIANSRSLFASSAPR
jgi:hypothetical protein